MVFLTIYHLTTASPNHNLALLPPFNSKTAVFQKAAEAPI